MNHTDQVIPGLERHYTRLSSGSRPGVGTIIPCFNQFEYTKRALDSYLASITLPQDHVLLVFDNHSQDETQEFFMSSRNGLGNICYFRYTENRGVTQPWNDGLRFCLKILRVNYAFLANNDVIFTRGCIERLVRCLHRAEDAHLIGPLTNRPGIHGAQNVRNFYSEYEESDDLLSIEGTTKALSRNRPMTCHELNGFFFGARASSFRKSIFQKVPVELYFDPRNAVIHNEREYQARLRQKGLNILLATNTFVFHYKGVTRRLGPDIGFRPTQKVYSAVPVTSTKRTANRPRLPRGGEDRFETTAPLNGVVRSAHPRVLIGICSCHQNAAKQAAVRKTWLMRLPPGVSAVFFVGAGNASFERDVISLRARDDYNGLPQKVRAFFRYALAHCEFDYLFKCDDDTYVLPERLFGLLKLKPGFVGSLDWWPSHADGGAGYLLSREAVRFVADEPCPKAGPEDVWVTRTLRSAGIEFQGSPLLKYDYREFPEAHNQLITAHHCSPAILEALDRGLLDLRSGGVRMAFDATHAAWRGPFVLLQNGMFLGGASRPHGRWKLANNRRVLVIDWFSWPGERLRKTASGYANSNLELSKAS